MASTASAIRVQLADAVALRQRGEHRLVQAAAEDLDLLALDERPQVGDEPGPLGPQPLEQRPGVVQPDAGSSGAASSASTIGS